MRRDLGSFGAPDMQALYALMHEIVDAYGARASDRTPRARPGMRQRVPDIASLRPTGLDTSTLRAVRPALTEASMSCRRRAARAQRRLRIPRRRRRPAAMSAPVPRRQDRPRAAGDQSREQYHLRIKSKRRRRRKRGRGYVVGRRRCERDRHRITTGGELGGVHVGVVAVLHAAVRTRTGSAMALQAIASTAASPSAFNASPRPWNERRSQLRFATYARYQLVHRRRLPDVKVVRCVPIRRTTPLQRAPLPSR